MAIDVAVVPVAGRGTRLLPLTKSQPKEMLPVGQKPVVQYVAEELAMSGVRRLLFITGPGKTAIENHFDINEELIWNLRENGQEHLLSTLSFEREQMEYFYSRQRRQLGLGHAVLCARAMVGHESFVVALGDSIIGLHAQSQIVRRMNDVFEAEAADAVIAFEQVPQKEVVHYGIASVRSDNDGFFELDNLVEKPAVAEAPSCLAVAARYVFKPAIFDYLERTAAGKGNEIQLTDAIGSLIRDGGKVLGVSLPPTERRFDIGNFPSYFRAFFEFALEDPLHGDALKAMLQAKLSETACKS
jgi:UTP--glucose-1-phosphate uridylyltransferase